MAEQKTWGLYDTKDNMWMGNDDGPLTYTDYMIARIAAQVMDEQLGHDLDGRIQAREYDPAPKRKRGEVAVKRSALDALRRIEGE